MTDRRTEGDLLVDDNGLTVLISEGQRPGARRLVVPSSRWHEKVAKHRDMTWPTIARAFLDAEAVPEEPDTAPKSAVPHGAAWLDDTIRPPVLYRWNAFALSPDGAPRLYGRWERDHLADSLLLALRVAVAGLLTQPKIDEPYQAVHRTAHAYATAAIQAAIAKAEGREITPAPGLDGSLGQLLERVRDLIRLEPHDLVTAEGQTERMRLLGAVIALVGEGKPIPSAPPPHIPHMD